MAANGEIPGIVDADTTLKLDKPELRCRSTASARPTWASTARDIGTALRLMVGGDEEVSRFRDEGANEDYDVQLRLTEADPIVGRPDPAICTCRGKNGGLDGSGQPGDARARRRRSRASTASTASGRSISCAAGVAPGYALGDRIEAIRAAAERPEPAAGYSTGRARPGRELERTFTEFLWAFLLSVIFMYMILAMNYESLIHPLTILLSLPLTVPFALLSLWLTGGTLNLYSALGILVLFGVVKKNSILQIDHMNDLRAKGMAALRGDHPGQPRPPAADPDDHARAGRRHAAAGDRHRPRRGRTPRRRGRRHRRADAVAAADAAGDAGGVLVLR